MRDRPYLALILALAALMPLGLLAVYLVAVGAERPLSWVDYLTVGLFVLAMALAMVEEFTSLRKSKLVACSAPSAT